MRSELCREGLTGGWPSLSVSSVVKTGTRFIRRHAWQLGAGACVVALFAIAVTPAATADPIAQKQAQASALASQIDALGRKESALSEQYDKAQLDAQAAADQVAAAAAKDAAAEAAAGRARDVLRVNAVEAYLHGGTLAVVASRAADPASLVDGGILRGEYVQSLAGSQADALDSFHLASLEAKEAKADYLAAEQDASRSAANVNTARNAAAASAQALQTTLAGVKGDIATLVAQVQAAKAAADALAARQAQARLLAQQVPSRGTSATPNPSRECILKCARSSSEATIGSKM